MQVRADLQKSRQRGYHLAWRRIRGRKPTPERRCRPVFAGGLEGGRCTSTDDRPPKTWVSSEPDCPQVMKQRADTHDPPDGPTNDQQQVAYLRTGSISR